MADLYSAKFIEYAGLSGTVNYTVPAGFRVIVRTVTMFDNGLLPVASCVFKSFTTNAGLVAHVSAQQTVPSSTVQDCRIVFNEGEVFGFEGAPEIGTFDVHCSGYLLTLP